jgi:D-alanyl-D-alanine carboxypeptidase
MIIKSPFVHELGRDPVYSFAGVIPGTEPPPPPPADKKKKADKDQKKPVKKPAAENTSAKAN